MQNALILLMFLLTACGTQDLGVNPVETDALLATDLHVVVDQQASALPDVLLEDATPEASVLPADVTQTPVGMPAWLTGTWLDCAGAATLTADQKLVWKVAGDACTVQAHVVWHEPAMMDIVPDQVTNCTKNGPPQWMDVGLHPTFDGDQLTLVLPKLFTGFKRFSHNPERQHWHVSGGKDQSGKAVEGDLSVCFDEKGRFYDGGWRSDPCTLIACGALVTQFKEVNGVRHIWTECQGDCPCTSIIIAKTFSENAMSGKYASANCEFAQDGAFTATRMPFPTN